MFELFELQGVGAKKVKALYEQLGVKGIPELEAACKDGRVAGLAGFGDKTALKMLAAIEARGQYADTYRLGTVAPLAEAMLEHLRRHPEVTQACIAGSYRRRKETRARSGFHCGHAGPGGGDRALHQPRGGGGDHRAGADENERAAEAGCAGGPARGTNEQYPFALAYFTGSKEHNVKIRGLAQARGWTLNEYRLAPVEGKKAAPVPAINEEADLHEALGLQYIEPELRENLGEIEAAAARELPALVYLENLRGTFHNHTTASDGRSTLAEMAGAARCTGAGVPGHRGSLEELLPGARAGCKTAAGAASRRSGG